MINTPSPINRFVTLVATLAIASLLLQTTQAQQSDLLFKDTFDVSAASDDLGFESATRQTGPLKPLTYTVTGNGAAQLGQSDALNRLKLSTPTILVSPDHNFTEGSTFRIDFDVDPGVNDASSASMDWAAIVFGATTQNAFVNGSDGMGVLFRNNGGIQVFDGGSAIYGGSGDVTVPTNALFHVRIEVDAASFGSSATVRMFINGQQARLNGNSLDHVKAAGFRGNYITLLGYSGPADGWVHLFDNLEINATGCVDFLTHRVETRIGQTVPVLVQVPPAFVTNGAATVTVTARNPAVAALVGAVNNQLMLTFSPGGPYSTNVDINVTGTGVATFELSNSRGFCSGQPLTLVAGSAFIRNPSFEKNYSPGFPHYSDVDDWIKTGGTGVNDSSGPFHDSGMIPDQARVAFIQGTASLAQMVSGLSSNKQYWLQFYYNARGCCGGTLDLTPSFNSVPLETISDVKAVGGVKPYYFRNVPFQPGVDSGELLFSTTAVGDATATLDAITIVERDTNNVIVMNPSFEASGSVPAPGYLTNIAGWTGSGQVGINFSGAGPFADNGKTSDQDNVAFLQDVSSLSQLVPRLVSGENYQLSFLYNARSNNNPHLQVQVNGGVIYQTDVTPVGGSAAYRTNTVTFMATNASAMITFAQTTPGDQTVLIDDIRLVGKSVSLPCLAVSPDKAELTSGQIASVLVTIPAALNASSSATIKFRSANTNVAVLVGAAPNGILSLNYSAGGPTTNSFEVRAVSRGNAAIDVIDSAGLCVENGVAVSVITSFVRNPSFEADPRPAGVGYGAVSSWSKTSGNIGLNNSTGPFQDNGVIPDRQKVALFQGTGVMFQQISGLIPGKTYWLQFRYNVRNCCGGTVDLAVSIGGVQVASISAIAPVGGTNEYYFQQVEFTPTASSGPLGFSTTITGDGTLLLDAINIVQRDTGQVVVQNPSFEASGAAPFPGYLQPARLSGWTGAGQYGVNVSGPGPFADNGINPDQDNVAFLQGQSSLSQTLNDLTPGQNYTVRVAATARNGNSPRLKISVDGNALLDENVTPVGSTNAYTTKSVAFTAAGASAVLLLEQTVAGDQTLLVDNVIVVPGGVARPSLTIRRLTDGSVRISWPVSATGYRLQETATLPASWANSSAAVTVEGSEYIVPINPAGASRFFRLTQ